MSDPSILWLFVGAFYITCGVLLAVAFWLCKRINQNLIARATSELELIGHVRLTMQDLLSRDPQIAEPLEVALLELDRWEREARRMSGGLARPWGIKQPGGSRWEAS